MMKERQRWQPEEDALLRSYVKQYGPKEWNLITQRMGKPLERDPKSCLERWKNYLKPGIKKGSLTPEEQNLVISLQAKYGNKWKKIAAEVPGRTAKRLGKWWEVFKEKQLKQLQKSNVKSIQDSGGGTGSSAATGSPENAAQGKYDHILETFAEKYVQPANNLQLSTTAFAPWTNNSSLTSSSSSTHSPSVSLTLSPSDPGVLDPEPRLFYPVSVPVQQMGALVLHCKELEEKKENWVRHKKEANWRLSRLEQQLESEKSRRMKEKMEEIEAKIRCLREEEMAFMSRIEGGYREEMNDLQREEEAKEQKLMEVWHSKQLKLGKLIQQIRSGVHSSSSSSSIFHGYSADPPV